MTHPSNCDCDACFVDELNAVLRRFVELREARDLRRAFELQPQSGRFVERRELGKPPVDPDAEQLAGQVGELAGELGRGVA
jgi:hypothetical protein